MRVRLVLACVRAYYIALVLAQSLKYRVLSTVLVTRFHCRMQVARVLFALLRLVLQAEK